MKVEIANHERLRELAVRIETSYSADSLKLLKLNLLQADGETPAGEIHAVAAMKSMNNNPTRHSEVINMAAQCCLDLEIEPPVIVLNEHRKRQVTFTGKALRFALMSDLDSDQLIRAIELEEYILNGSTSEDMHFSAEVCAVVLDSINGRLRDPVDNFKLDYGAAQRLQELDYRLSARGQVMIDVSTNGELTPELEVPDEESDATADSFDLEALTNLYPEAQQLIERTYQYVCGSIENLEEDEWDEISSSYDVVEAFVGIVSQQIPGDPKAKAKLEVVANSIGIRVPKASVSKGDYRTTIARPRSRNRLQF